MRLDSAPIRRVLTPLPDHAMEILFVLLPVSVLLVLAILAILGWAVHSGQFEDIEQEGLRILTDESQKVEDNVERHQI